MPKINIKLVLLMGTVPVLIFFVISFFLLVLKQPPFTRPLQLQSVVMARMAADKGVTILKHVDFEVFGKVQGVYFRKHTRKTAVKYGLVGWVQNTHHKTVTGQVQGVADKVDIMKEWLKRTGSRNSSISRTEFKNEKNIDTLSFQDFKIIR